VAVDVVEEEVRKEEDEVDVTVEEEEAIRRMVSVAAEVVHEEVVVLVVGAGLAVEEVVQAGEEASKTIMSLSFECKFGSSIVKNKQKQLAWTAQGLHFIRRSSRGMVDCEIIAPFVGFTLFRCYLVTSKLQ
jgi:hypothetical protein